MADNEVTNNSAAQPAGDRQGQRFGVQRVYIKDSSFEAPDTPNVFKQQYNPQVNFSINNKSTRIDEGLYEVVLRLTADVKQDEKTIFLVEVHQAGIFEVRGIEGDQLEQVLTIACPNVLFPYGREAIDALVTRGSFPALLLAPINFESIYMQAKQQQAQQGAPAAAVTPPDPTAGTGGDSH